MRVQDRARVRESEVDLSVQCGFRGRTQGSVDRAAFHVDDHDVVEIERTLVTPRDGDAAMAVVQPHRKVAASGGSPTSRRQFGTYSRDLLCTGRQTARV